MEQQKLFNTSMMATTRAVKAARRARELAAGAQGIPPLWCGAPANCAGAPGKPLTQRQGSSPGSSSLPKDFYKTQEQPRGRADSRRTSPGQIDFLMVEEPRCFMIWGHRCPVCHSLPNMIRSRADEDNRVVIKFKLRCSNVECTHQTPLCNSSTEAVQLWRMIKKLSVA